MPLARLTVTVPEDLWIGDVSRTHPDAELRVLAGLADGDTGVGLLEVHHVDTAGVVTSLEGRDEITALEVLQRDEDRALVQVETTSPLLLLPAQESGTPLEMPFTIVDGEAEWEITASQERLSQLGRQLDAFDIPFRVEELRQQVEPEQLLTDRQLRLVRAAVEQGYYDTPRECTLTELAEHLGVAKSTCSETLHRAEGRIIKKFLERAPTPTLED